MKRSYYSVSTTPGNRTRNLCCKSSTLTTALRSTLACVGGRGRGCSVTVVGAGIKVEALHLFVNGFVLLKNGWITWTRCVSIRINRNRKRKREELKKAGREAIVLVYDAFVRKKKEEKQADRLFLLLLTAGK